jgi:adenylate kinase
MIRFSFIQFSFDYLLRNIDGIKDCFKSILRSFNADQPLNDVFTQVESYTNKKPRSVAPCTPRIVILGPTGSGRKTVAMQISRKYDIPIGKRRRRKKRIDHIRNSLVSVSIPMLIKQQIADKTPIGASMKPYVTRQSLGKRLILIFNN